MYSQIFLSIFFCLFANSLAQSSCGSKGILGSGVSDADKQTIVDRHNFLRLQIANGQVPGQPKSSNMKRMVWDDAIAAQAQNLTNSCVFQHIRYRDSRWPWVGQNLLISYAGDANSGADWTAAVDYWFNEVKYFKYPNSTVPLGKTVGHYTQVVWAESYAVGCGLTKYYDDKKKWYANLIACNYGPGGNYVGAAPYKTGPGCENLC